MDSIWGWVAMAVVGFSLGFFGGGGGILTVPVLTYLFQLPAEQATGYSLWVVGSSSLVGALRAAFKHSIEYKSGVLLLAPSMVMSFSVRRWVIPAMPAEVAHLGGLTISKNSALLLLFGGVMLLVAARMIKQAPSGQEDPKLATPASMLIIGAAVGILAGLIGAGGGFLIVPALMIYGGLRIKEAVGTSLMVIAAQSLFGFSGEAMARPIQWSGAAMLATVAIGGLVLGASVGARARAEDIKKGFGWFVLIMGVFVLVREAIGLFSAA